MTIKNAISSAIVSILRPLIRILLKNNIPFGTFTDIARWVYVDVALNEFGIPGKKPSVSRASILTGLSRKEVSLLRDFDKMEDLGTVERYNRGGRVITGWCKDADFTDESGNPLLLEADGERGFGALVAKYSGDVPARAVLDELLNAGIVDFEDGKVRLLSRGYIVKTGDIEKLNIMGIDAGALISTIHHNMVSSAPELFLQRKVYYDNIPQECLPEVKAGVNKSATEFIDSVDRMISGYDRDINPGVKGRGRRSAGLGVFYFE